KDIREGNKEYRQGKFTDAEVDYRKALETDARSVEAAYNLGNTLYKQGKGQESLEQYQIVVGNEKDKTKLSMAWHNVGNIFMATKDYKRSIDAYKNALRNNPKDNETRYNLALAQKLLDDQQNQDQNQDQQKDEQKQDEQQQDQDQQNQDQQQDQKDQQDQQQNPDKMSKQNADHILDAMMQEEKNTQEKVKMEQMNRQKQKKTDKNW
ncbi:MAG: tetratricopeptide repeat protein, partial [Candidatus Symbiothrix sp.]|nr:tetratricopeptide repeat protein [Candidatus Symbiothrix sp.]